MTALTPPTTTTPVTGTTGPRRERTRWGWTVVAAIVGVLFIAPAAWILIGSARPSTDIVNSMSPLSWSTPIPQRLTGANYSQLFSIAGFGRPMLNSLLVCTVSVVVGLAVSAPAAYAFAVLKFRGRGLLFAVVVISFLVPFEAIAIPLAQQFTTWGLANTYVGLILPGVGNGLAIFNLRQAFLGIPSSFREAALIDGGSEPRILGRIYLPLSGGALINSAILLFLAQWTSYLWPLLITSSSNLLVAPLALAKTYSEHSFNFGENFAGSVLLSLIPALLLFVLQRFFALSVAASGNKRPGAGPRRPPGSSSSDRSTATTP